MLTNLGALRISNPSAWEKEIRRAMKESAGRIPDAATALGISGRTLNRWLDDPLLAKARCSECGKHVSNGSCKAHPKDRIIEPVERVANGAHRKSA